MSDRKRDVRRAVREEIEGAVDWSQQLDQLRVRVAALEAAQDVREAAMRKEQKMLRQARGGGDD